MVVAFGEHLEGGEGIGVQGLPGCNGLLGKGLDAGLVYPANRFHGDKARLPAIMFACNQDGRLAFGTSSALAGAFAADEGIVQLDDAFQSVQAVLVAHRHPQFPQHPLGRQPRYADQLGQAQGRNAALVGGHPVNAPKPLDQGQFGVME